MYVVSILGPVKMQYTHWSSPTRLILFVCKKQKWMLSLEELYCQCWDLIFLISLSYLLLARVEESLLHGGMAWDRQGQLGLISIVCRLSFLQVVCSHGGWPVFMDLREMIINFCSCKNSETLGLDRALCSAESEQLFPNCLLRSEATDGSDHCPLLLGMNVIQPSKARFGPS